MRAVHVAEHARNFRLTSGSGQPRYVGRKLNHPVSENDQKVKGDAKSASHPREET
jgi:hypothetical protein